MTKISIKSISNYLKYLRFLVSSLSRVPNYIKQNKFTWANIVKFIQGNYRMYAFENLDNHIREQFFFRLTRIDTVCKTNKQCYCGCELPELLLSNPACEKNCYFTFLDEDQWNLYKKTYKIDLEKCYAQAGNILLELDN
jgi:hypothetical protein